MKPCAQTEPLRYRGPELRTLLARLRGAATARRSRTNTAHGFQYGDLPDGLVDLIPEWLASRRVPGGEEIRPGRVYRYGALLVKFYGPGHPIKDCFRRSPAIRSADWYAKLWPIRTPHPLLAVETRSFGRLQAALLITEFIRGPSLYEVWRQTRPQEALSALPEFLAQMHRHHVYHGDLHTLNVLWDDRGWALIDLDGMRRRRSIGRRIIERQWVRICTGLGCDEALRPYFDAYVEAAGLHWDREDGWQRIYRASCAAAARRGEKSGTPQASAG